MTHLAAFDAAGRVARELDERARFRSVRLERAVRTPFAQNHALAQLAQRLRDTACEGQGEGSVDSRAAADSGGELQCQLGNLTDQTKTYNLA